MTEPLKAICSVYHENMGVLKTDIFVHILSDVRSDFHRHERHMYLYMDQRQKQELKDESSFLCIHPDQQLPFGNQCNRYL